MAKGLYSFQHTYLEKLWHGPVYAHEFDAPALRLPDRITGLNRAIRPAGWHISGEWVDVDTKFGRLHERLYRLHRIPLKEEI